MTKFYADLKDLAETTFEQNSRTKITFICHSMGCPIMSYFFNQQSQSWKDMYVHALISLGGAWGGAVKALKAFASGKIQYLKIELIQFFFYKFVFLTFF